MGATFSVEGENGISVGKGRITVTLGAVEATVDVWHPPLKDEIPLARIVQFVRQFNAGAAGRSLTIDTSQLTLKTRQDFLTGVYIECLERIANGIRSDAGTFTKERGLILSWVGRLRAAVICRSLKYEIEQRHYGTPSNEAYKLMIHLIESLKVDPSADWLRAVLSVEAPDLAHEATHNDTLSNYTKQCLRLIESHTPKEIGWWACQHVARMAMFPGHVGEYAKIVVEKLVRSVSPEIIRVTCSNTSTQNPSGI